MLAGAGFVLWRVQSKPVDLDWAAPVVRAAANAAAFNGAVSKIETVRLAKVEKKGGYLLSLSDVRLGKRAAGASARLPNVDIVFHPQDFLSGKAGPRQVLIDGASLRIVRRTDKRMKLDFGAGAGERARVFQSLTGGAYFREAFESAELRNVTITFVDEASGRTWTGRQGSADVKRTRNGYAASLSSEFLMGGNSAALAFNSNYDLATEVISSNLTVKNAPVGDLVAVFFNENAELLTSPVSGSATIDLDKTGVVLASRIDLNATGGALTLGGFSTPVEALAVAAAFDPKRNEFTLERAQWDAGVGEGAIGGVISLIQSEAEKGVARVNFSLSGETIAVNLPSVFPGAIDLDRLSTNGSYSIAEKRLDLDAISAGLLGVAIEGRVATARKTPASPSVSAELKIDGALDPQTLLKLWPTKLALGARDFIAERMLKGSFSGVEIAVALKEGGVAADGALPDEALSIAFRADGAEVVFAPGMTPLTNVSGRGLLKGNSFRFDAEKADVARVNVLKGAVEIPILMPKGEPAFFRFTVAGDAGDILTILDQEPLKVLKETKFTPEQFAGPVQASVEIQRPNLRVAPQESYRYDGVATFKNLAVSDIVGDASLEGVKGRLDLATSGMVIVGDGKVGEAPVSIEWRQRFHGTGDKTVIAVKGEADSAMADLFGIPTRQMVQGGVPFTAKAVGGVDAFRALDLEADFTKATLVSEALGWMKGEGVPAKGNATFLFSPDGMTIPSLTLTGDGVLVSGSAAFAPGGAVKSFDIPRFVLAGAADLSIAGVRNGNGVLILEVAGAHLNAADMVRKLVDEGMTDSGGKTPLALSARIDRVDFRGGASYRDALLDYRRAENRIEELRFSATSEDAKPLSIELKSAGAVGEQVIEAKSENIGQLLAGLFAMSSVKGGYGHLDFAFTPGATDAPRAGALEAHDIRVVKAPLFAKIFAAGSLTGLADLMNGDGIELQNARADFSIKNGEISLKEARATGPSVGITGEGAFSIDGDRRLTLRGAVAPAYQVNSFLGKTPVIGDLFVNRKGEGLLALSYEVDGTTAEPRVTVNPLSALAPGVLRRMFEGAPPPAE